jgi:electron transfer flavoprotein beta subunit
VATQLAEVIKTDQFDLVLCGIESSDYNGSNVGGMIAEFLDCASVSAVSGVEVKEGKAVVTREIDGGKEVVSAASPLVAIVQKGIAKEPRIAAMRGIMMARSKQIKVVEPVAVDSLTELVNFEMPEARAACKFVDPDNAGELINILQNEAKVI